MILLQRRWLAGLAGLLLCGAEADGALTVLKYLSPRNAQRPRRAVTDLVILHTTEGPAAGSLRKIHDRGEAHYVVDPTGRVFNVIDRDRVAFHAGRSMWEGRTALDNSSIGIEIVGTYNRPITAQQAASVRELIAGLQLAYRIPDQRVLSHSMVAYGAPNRWHRRSHRGRKRCGMLFATRAVRRAIGLEAEPVCDPDVAAGRLVNADPYLASVLYGEAARQPLVAAPPPPLDDSRLSVTRSAWDIAREQYASSNTVYVLPDGRELRGSTITNWSKVPIGTRVVLDAASEASDDDETVKVLGVDGKTAREIAGEEYARASTIYFLSNGVVRTGAELRESAFPALPAGTRMLVGYVYGGRITSSRQAFEVCGRQWNYPSTFYRLPSGEVRAGNTMDENSIPRGTLVFFQE